MDRKIIEVNFKGIRISYPDLYRAASHEREPGRLKAVGTLDCFFEEDLMITDPIVM